MIGGWADYGTWRCARFCTKCEQRVTVEPYRPNITIFFTLLAVGVSFAWLGVEDPSRWCTGVALYVLGCGSRDFCSYCLISTHAPAVLVIQVRETMRLLFDAASDMPLSRVPLHLDCRVPWPGSQSPRSSRLYRGGETRIKAVSTPVWIHLRSLADWSR